MNKLPAATKELIKTYSECLREDLKYYPDFKDKLQIILQQLSSDYNYGFHEALMQKKPIRYPHEIKNQLTCFEAGVLSYLVIKELGFNARLKIFDMQNNNDFYSGEYTDHTIIEVINNDEKYYFDLVNNDILKVAKEEDNKVFFEDDFNKSMTYKSFNVIESLDSLIEKMDYLQTLEGSVEALTQKYRVNASHLLHGMIKTFIYFQYEKESNEFKTSVKCLNANHLNLNINIIEKVGENSGNVSFNASYETSYPSFTFDKKLLDEVFTLFSLKNLVKCKEFWPSNLATRLILDDNLDDLAEEHNIELSKLEYLNLQLNNALSEAFSSIDKDKDLFFLNICMMNDYYLISKKAIGRGLTENYYDDEQIIKGVKKLIRKAKETSVKEKSKGYNVRLKHALGEDWKDGYSTYRILRNRFKELDDYLMALNSLLKNKNIFAFQDMDTSMFKDEVINRKIIALKRSLKKARFIELGGEKIRITKKNFEKVYSNAIYNMFKDEGCTALNGFRQLGANAVAKYFYLKPNIESSFVKKNAFSIINRFRAQAHSL